MFDYSKLPLEMRQERRWVLWRRKRLPDGRVTKIPVDAMTGYGAKSNDPSTWCGFEEAERLCEPLACDGLGFMLGGDWFGVDIDHAKGSPIVDEFLAALDTYAEISQSGDGLHLICKGRLPRGNRRKGNVEMYDEARFFAMTGDSLGRDYAKDCTDAIKPLYDKYLKGADETPQSAPKTQKKPNLSDFTDAELIRKARESRSGSLISDLLDGRWEDRYPSQSQADLALCSALAFWLGGDAQRVDRAFRESGLMRDKWDEQRGQGKTYGSITVQKAVDGATEFYEPKPREERKPLGDWYKPKKAKEAEPKAFDLNDTGNAERFMAEHGEDVRYNFDNKAWMVWDGSKWAKDATQETKRMADAMMDAMKRESFSEGDEKKAAEMWRNVKHLASNGGKEAMLREAMHIGDAPTVNADYDKDPWLLNCEDCVIDLRTGERMPHDRRLMMSKRTAVRCDMDHEPKAWLKALDGIFQGKRDVIDFVRKAVGYSLTGSVKEQCIFQCFGNGSNGKGVFFHTLYSALGDYAINSQVETILTKRGGGGGAASPDVARLNGARFVTTNEPREGDAFNEGLLKQLTGGDVITARFLYGQDFEFAMKGKIWVACNYKIVVRGTDKGIWRRMRLIPFEATFEGKSDDKDLEEKLQTELPQILGWAVKGAMEWYKDGLPMPKEIQEATAQYRTEMDVVESYSKERIAKKRGSREKASDVYADYKEWARQGNEWLMSQSKFGIELGKRFEKRNINGYVYYDGIRLRKKEGSYVYQAGEKEAY